MNFKLSRQQVLPMVLLIAGVLFAIYLLKPTLEGAVDSGISYCVTYNNHFISPNDIPQPNLNDDSYINLMIRDKQQIPAICGYALEKSCKNLSSIEKYSECMECTDKNKTALQQAGCNIFDYDAYCNNRHTKTHGPFDNSKTMDPILKCYSKVNYSELPPPLPKEN